MKLKLFILRPVRSDKQKNAVKYWSAECFFSFAPRRKLEVMLEAAARWFPKILVQRLVPLSRPAEQEAGEEIKSSEGTSININFHKFLVLWQPLEDFSSPFSTWTMSKLAKLNGKWREHRKFPLSLSLHRLFRLLSRSESQHGLYRRKEKLPKRESEAKEKKIVE